MQDQRQQLVAPKLWVIAVDVANPDERNEFDVRAESAADPLEAPQPRVSGSGLIRSDDGLDDVALLCKFALRQSVPLPQFSQLS